MPVLRSKKNRRFSRSHVLDVKLSARHRREVRTRWLTTGLGVAIGIVAVMALVWRGGVWFLEEYVYRNPAFAIKGIDVRTDGVIARTQILRWAGVKEGQNLLALELGRVKHDLETVPAIRQAIVERVLPNGLRVRISERQPVAQFVYARPGGAGGYTRAVCLLDRDGFLMQPLEASQRATPAASFSNLPILTGLSLRDLVPGRQVSSSQVIEALRLIEAFGRSPMAGRSELRQIDLASPGVLQASTSPYGEIVFRAQNFDQQLQRWGAIEAFGRRAGRRLATLDLSVANNIPATWLAGEVSFPANQ